METMQYLYRFIYCLCGGILVTKNIQGLLTNYSEICDVIEADSSLQFVISIYRHGVRSPLSSFPSDPYKDRSIFFPEGNGALTKVGKQLMYKVGRTIRNRYNTFLDPIWSDKVRFVSTNMERTMMSAMLVASGMFPPQGHQRWSTDINWQPIPIWLDNSETDKALLWDDSSSCPRFKNDSTDLRSKATLPDSNPQHDFYEFISEKTGDLRNSEYDIFMLWDTLECEHYNGFTLPKWTEEIYPDKLKDMVAETFNLMVNGTYSMLSILSGPLYHRVYDLLQAKVNGSLVEGRRMYLHSGHDVSVLAFLRGLGYKPLLIVRPGDGIFLELHCSSNTYYVKMFYLSLLTVGEVFQELAIPGCPSPCDLLTFLSLASPLSPEEWAAECSV